jgi:ribonuclease HI
MNETLTLQFDGGSRGNPGPAGIGVVVRAADGTPLVTLGRFIGRATNNVAEYRALITAMEEALKLGAKKIVIRGDSELIVKQMTGEYRVKNPDLRVLYNEAQDLLAQFDAAKIEHNYRESNALADKLANLAMDKKKDIHDADDPGDTGPAAGMGSSSVSRPMSPAGATPAAARPMKLVQVRSDSAAGAHSAAVGEQFTCPRCGCSITVKKASNRPASEQGPFQCVCGVRMKPAAE